MQAVFLSALLLLIGLDGQLSPLSPNYHTTWGAHATTCDDAKPMAFQATVDGVRYGCDPSFCTDPVRSNYAKRYCGKTCNTCPAVQTTVSPFVCEDRDEELPLVSNTLKSCASAKYFCSTMIIYHLCPQTCNSCSLAQSNAGSCNFGCDGDPYLCYLLGFLYPKMDYGYYQATPCTTSCVASAGRWGGLLSNWFHCLNYTRPLSDDCSTFEIGFYSWNIKNTICSLCPSYECNDLSLVPTSEAIPSLSAESFPAAPYSPRMFTITLSNTDAQAQRTGVIGGALTATLGGASTQISSGSICADQGWTMKEALVACRELGLGIALRAFAHPHAPAASTIGYIECEGGEQALDQCMVRVNNPNRKCFSSAAVYCSGPIYEPNPGMELSNRSGILNTILGDADQNGLPDIFVASFREGFVGWHRNLGYGRFSPLIVLVPNAPFPRGLGIADLDLDGDLDLIYSTTAHGMLAIIPNVGGVDVFAGKPIIIVEESPSINDLTIIDYDNDGWPDIVCTIYWYYNYFAQRHKLIWFRNNGRMNFTGPLLIAPYTHTSGPMIVRASDVNNDKLLDLVVVQPFFSVITSFQRQADMKWKAEKELARGVAGVTWVDFCDINNDGVQDMVVAIYRADFVAWYRQIGAGEYDSYTVIGSVPGVMSVSCADVNSDGLMDVVAVGMDSDSLSWFPNRGAGVFSNEDRIIVSTMFGRPASVVTADLDQDGDNDIVVGQYTEGGATVVLNKMKDPTCTNKTINAASGCGYGWTCVNNSQVCSQCHPRLHLEDGQCVPCAPIPHCASMECSTHDMRCKVCDRHYVVNAEGFCIVELFHSTDINVVAPGTQFSFTVPADFDKDGILDVLSLQLNDINPLSSKQGFSYINGIIQMNWGTPVPRTYDSRVIANQVSFPRAAAVTDMNMDGWPDFYAVYETGNKLVCWVNQGPKAPRNFSEYLINNLLSTPKYLLVSDFDYNGYPDVMVLYFNSEQLYVFANNKGTTFVPIGLPVVGRALQFALDDLDQDGLIDVVVGASQPGQVLWLRNVGSVKFQPYLVSSLEATGITVGCISPGNCHHIFFSASAIGAIMHCRLTQNYSFFCTDIAHGTGDCRSLYLSDLYKDNLPAVVISSFSMGFVGYIENLDGQGTFGALTVIADSIDSPNMALPHDMDGDGDDDILVSSLLYGSLFWFDNRLIDHEPPSVLCPTEMLIVNAQPTTSFGVFAPPAVCMAVASVCTSQYLLLSSLAVLSDGTQNISLPVGRYTIMFRGVDLHTNIAVCNFTVSIVDTTSPAIVACPPNVLRITRQPFENLSLSELGLNLGRAVDNNGVVRTAVVRSNARPESVAGLAFSTTDSKFFVGTTPMTFVALDAANNSATCNFDVNIVPSLVMTPFHLVEDVVFRASMINLSAVPGINFQFALNAGDPLPLGLTLDERTGEIRGAVTGGSWLGLHSNICVTVTDISTSAANRPSVALCNMSIQVWPPLVFYESLTTTQDGPIGLFTPTVTGGAGSYVYTFSFGDNFLPGVSVSSITGALEGSAELSGRFSLTIFVTDTVTGVVQARDRIELQVLPRLEASWSTSEDSLPFTLGVFAIGPHINVTGGQSPYRFEIDSGAPPGLVIDSGVLQGSPSQIGDFNMVVTVTDAHKAMYTMPALRVVVVEATVQATPSTSTSGLASSSTFAISLSIVLAFAVLATCGFVYYYLAVWRRRAIERKEPDKELKGILETHIPPYVGADYILRMPLECSPQDIRKISTLGSGYFGQVYKASLRLPSQGGASVLVAMKHLLGTSAEAQRRALLQEACLLAQFKHPNVLEVFGVVITSAGIQLLTSFCEHGDLLSFLRHRSGFMVLAYESRCQILRDVANGMAFLSKYPFVHRDLASRNILVTSHFEFQISDFGLSRPLTNGVYIMNDDNLQSLCAIRWAAIETFCGQYFHESDVWSFGVLAHEVFTNGTEPYSNIAEADDDVSNQIIRDFVISGGRLSSPPNCPADVFATMSHCWAADVRDRPSFQQLADFFRKAAGENENEQLHAAGEAAESTLEPRSVEDDGVLVSTGAYTSIKQLPAGTNEHAPHEETPTPATSRTGSGGGRGLAISAGNTNGSAGDVYHLAGGQGERKSDPPSTVSAATSLSDEWADIQASAEAQMLQWNREDSGNSSAVFVRSRDGYAVLKSNGAGAKGSAGNELHPPAHAQPAAPTAGPLPHPVSSHAPTHAYANLAGLGSSVQHPQQQQQSQLTHPTSSLTVTKSTKSQNPTIITTATTSSSSLPSKKGTLPHSTPATHHYANATLIAGSSHTYNKHVASGENGLEAGVAGMHASSDTMKAAGLQRGIAADAEFFESDV